MALMCWAAPATAAPVDSHSAHLGLRAYRAYLSSLVSRLHVVKSNDAALVRSVRANCLHVLTPVTGAGHASPGATRQFGDEVGADLLIASFAAYRAPLATLTQRIERLQWSRETTGRRIAAALDAQRQVFDLAPSDLCADATAFAASGGKSVSPATRAFLRNFNQVTSGDDIRTLVHTLRRFRPPGDRKFQKQLDRIQLHADDRLLAVLVNPVFDLLDALGFG
jgi:hypothetical protein